MKFIFQTGPIRLFVPYKRRKKDAQNEVARKKTLVATSKSPSTDSGGSPSKDSSSLVWKTLPSQGSGDAGTGNMMNSIFTTT